MAKPIMVQGVMSNVGKSLITAGLCRIFMQDGYKTAPFKSQNMALNSFITPDGYEIGRAQAMQAEAAGMEADIRMNPILLKPMGDNCSQVILKGEPYANMKAAEYFKVKHNFVPQIMEAYESLSRENDIIVIEGAGSPAEINLNQCDIVNMGLAKMLQSPVLLVADIDRGGVFATLYGTVALLPEYSKYFKGGVVNKFRGDKTLIEPALRDFESKINMPILGIVPHLTIDIDDEDSLSRPFGEFFDPTADIDVAVVKLPHISNFTDFKPFTTMDGVKVRYVSKADNFITPDLLIIPGTKNTIGDLRYLTESGLKDVICQFAQSGKPVIGICGGFQMMGKSIADPHNFEGGGRVEGFGFFNSETIFEGKKEMTRVKGEFLHNINGFFSCLQGKLIDGYEIHMGRSSSIEENISRLETSKNLKKYDGLAKDNFFGVYVHGVFDNPEVTQGIINKICAEKGLPPRKCEFENIRQYKETQYDKLALALRQTLQMDKIYSILEKGINEE